MSLKRKKSFRVRSKSGRGRAAGAAAAGGKDDDDEDDYDDDDDTGDVLGGGRDADGDSGRDGAGGRGGGGGGGGGGRAHEAEYEDDDEGFPEESDLQPRARRQRRRPRKRPRNKGDASTDGGADAADDGGEVSSDLAQSVFRKVFRELDTNRSGELSRREVRGALSRLGLPTTPDVLEPMFRECDVNNDGVISYREFKTYARRREEELRLVFDDLDTNGDGIVDETDIRAGLRQLGLRASDEKITSLINKMDQTNDGIITFGEFQRFLMLLPTATLEEYFDQWGKAAHIDLGENMQVPDELDGSAGDALILFASGAAAGAVSRTATAPFDRLKVLLQAGPTGGSFTVRAAAAPESTILGGLRAIYGEGGAWAFFRGNGTNVIKIMPESATKFYAYDWFKRRLARDPDNIRIHERFTAGALAGVTAQTMIYPLEIVKTRLAVARRGEYRGITHCLLKTIEADGPRGVFAGLGASCVGIIPYAGIDLGVFMTLKQQWINAHPEFYDEGPGALTLLGMGAFSSSCGQVVAYPLQLVRTKLQAQVRGRRRRRVLFGGRMP